MVGLRRCCYEYRKQKLSENSGKLLVGILAAIFILIYWTLGLSLIFVIPSFSGLFDSFGANIHDVTRFVLENRLLIGISVLILYFAQMIYLIYGYFKVQKNGAMKPLYIKLIAFIVLGIVLEIALIGIMYLPILNMQNP